MKKIAEIITVTAIVLSALIVPAATFAQVPEEEVPTVEITDTDPLPTTTTDTTTPTTAGVPETGIAPQPSKLLQNTLIFIVGSSIGAGIGYGIVSYKKNRLNS